jgi:hypothetical protein
MNAIDLKGKFLGRILSYLGSDIGAIRVVVEVNGKIELFPHHDILVTPMSQEDYMGLEKASSTLTWSKADDEIVASPGLFKKGKKK